MLRADSCALLRIPDNCFARHSLARDEQLDTSLQQHNPRRGPDRATKSQKQGERHTTVEGDAPCGVGWERKRAYGDGMEYGPGDELSQIGRYAYANTGRRFGRELIKYPRERVSLI